MSFVVKEVGGHYYWTGHPSNNARDREREIVSAKALEADVADTSPRGEHAALRYGHLKVRIGPEPDWRGVVDGVLVEAGRFDDTPIAKAIAQHIMANPDAFDGNGWGMSIGFRGHPDGEGVFHKVRIHERSILPRSRAANPYTSFAAGGDMNELDKAALSEIEKILKSSALSPEAVETAKAMLSAKDQAKALDEDGVQRKATDPAPDAEDVDVEKKAKPPKSEDEKPPMADAEDEDGEDEEEEAKPKPKKRGKAKAADATDAPPEPAAPAPVATPVVDEHVIKAFAQFVDTRITEMEDERKKDNEEQVKAINDAFQTLTDIVTNFADQLEAYERRDKGLSAVNEAQSRVYDELMKHSASRSKATVVAEDDPLATRQPAPASDSPMNLIKKGRR